MDEIKECLVAEFLSVQDADVGLQFLETADFDNQSVSIVSPGNDTSVTDVARLEDDTSESPATGGSAAVAGAVGGSLSAALGTATLIGPFMVVGPLVGMVVGAGAAGLLSGTERWGTTGSARRSSESSCPAKMTADLDQRFVCGINTVQFTHGWRLRHEAVGGKVS